MKPFFNSDEIYLVAARAHSLFLQGRNEEATVIFEGLVKVAPGDAYCTNALAALYIRQGQVERAIEILSDALAADPTQIETRARRCEAYLMLGRAAEAFQDGEILQRGSSGPERARIEVLLSGSKIVGTFKQLSSRGSDN